MNENGELLSVSEYDESGLLKNGRCFECEGGYVGYTDTGMRDFAQVNHGERSIRVIENNHKNCLVRRINELLSISECVNVMMQKL